jgi:hypothetical protein
MKRFLLACIALASSHAVAGKNTGQDSLYVYHDGGNIEYQCTLQFGYFETEGFSSVYFTGCEPIAIDYGQWPRFPEQRIYASIGINGQRARDSRYCQFVAHATVRSSGSTSTVLDCRE